MVQTGFDLYQTQARTGGGGKGGGAEQQEGEQEKEKTQIMRRKKPKKDELAETSAPLSDRGETPATELAGLREKGSGRRKGGGGGQAKKGNEGEHGEQAARIQRRYTP